MFPGPTQLMYCKCYSVASENSVFCHFIIAAERSYINLTRGSRHAVTIKISWNHLGIIQLAEITAGIEMEKALCSGLIRHDAVLTY